MHHNNRWTQQNIQYHIYVCEDIIHDFISANGFVACWHPFCPRNKEALVSIRMWYSNIIFYLPCFCSDLSTRYFDGYLSTGLMFAVVVE